jgi:hypothetical protein
LQDENLPFEQTEFSVALKKAIEDALDWYLSLPLYYFYEKIFRYPYFNNISIGSGFTF